MPHAFYSCSHALIARARASLWDRHDAAFPENAGDAGLGRSDPPCACHSDRRMPCACHDAKISMIRMLLHENGHAFACTGLAAHASEGCRIIDMA